MKTSMITLAFCLMTLLMQAQVEGAEMTILQMKDGSRLEGTVSSETDEQIVFQLFGGYEIIIDPEQIENREAGKSGRKYFPDGRWITTRGYYSVLNLSTTWGKAEIRFGENELLSGLKLQSIHGYRFNQYVSLGVSLGVHSFEMPNPQEYTTNYYYGDNSNFTTLPIELDVRGFLTDNRIAPYYAVNAGYGMAIFKNEEFISRKGGMSGQVELGVQFAGRKTGSFQLGLGYAIQEVEAEYTINRFGGDLRFINLDTRLHRLLLNFGWSF